MYIYAAQCTDDPDHITNLHKMHSAIKLITSDFMLHQTLLHTDLSNINIGDVLFSTIIVPGPYEHQELNAFIISCGCMSPTDLL